MERDQLIARRPSERGEPVEPAPLVGASCWLYLTVVGVLALAALVPPLLGMRSTMIVSGSMTPGIKVGDVVLSSPISRQAIDRLEPGDVITFRDPEHDRLVTHRIVEVLDDGTFRTRGDANRDPDRVPVPKANVVGKPTLLIPMAGMPASWLRSGRYTQLALLLLVTAAAILGTRSRRATAALPQRPRRDPAQASPRRYVPALATWLAVALALSLSGPQATNALFGDANDNVGNSITATTLGVPTGVTGTPGCNLVLLLPKVTLSWTAGASASGAKVLRSNVSGGAGTEIGSTSATTFTDSTVTAGSTYYYRIVSTAGLWTSAPSSEVPVSVPLTCV